ncbi:hypothetical protein HZS_8091 [Henneguya salminicola]|nr:hypothetical protein HZS_8091 [Henneguya salminicola]
MFRRSDTENKELNQMLLLDSSNGFQRAIQTDIDELNNPNIHEQPKKGDIPFAFFNNQKDYKNDPKEH